MSATLKVLHILVAAVILSGCTGPRQVQEPPITSVPATAVSPTPTLPPTINASVDLFTLKPELVKCQDFVMAFETTASAVRALLPPGYELDASATTPVTEVQIDVQRCESMIINNETVIPNFGLLILNARVRVNESLAKNAEIQEYALEILATNQTVVNLLRAVGFKVTLADITLEVGSSSGTQSAMRVTVDGNPWYEATSFRYTPFNSAENSISLRYHQVGEFSAVRWLDYNRTYQHSSLQGETVFRVDGGTAKALDATGGGVIHAGAVAGVARGPLAFGKL